jgi:hypothetical protein
MGVDVTVLVTEWEPAVAAYRAGGMDFFWDANAARNERFYAGDRSGALPELPFLDELDMPGGRRSFLYPCEFYDHLRRYLPGDLRGRLDTAFGAVLPGWGVDWIPEDRDDLSADAAVPADGEGGLYYAMRPATASAIAAIDVPWDELDRVGDLHPVPEDEPNHEYLHSDVLRWVAGMHLEAVADAAAQTRGVIGLITY